ncbi:DNA adenine methylase [Geobacter pelophilus]|uniref:site-specific DNA-methyltransferase (adenine-specific) n=1 Tax=Geoanaerobacter pelophilus TaxID=60036 RepID=A0AAW4L6S2_9BACT|nr:DNA adenine methylase [Geoanaerobacter pelophilus]MBT0666598.1 DNA adenine methylase [Geoanaerobacter pelophilus]
MNKPIFPWIGGKRRLAKHILPLIPEHTCYVEPCAGAAAILFMKEQSKVEVLNDINLDLVTLYRVVQHHLEEFLRQFKWALTSRKIFEWLQETPPETLTDIQRAARFFYLQKLSFGGKVDGRTFGTATTSMPRLNLLRLEEDLSQAHIRLARVCIEHLTWQRCMTKYDRSHTVFYLDPPYWQTEGYGVPFGIEQYQEMAEMMRAVKGHAILSINDHPDIQEIFKSFSSKLVDIDYTVGGGAKGVGRKELIIWNW